MRIFAIGLVSLTILTTAACSHAPARGATSLAAPSKSDTAGDTAAPSLGGAAVATDAHPPAPGDAVDPKTQTLLDQGYYFYARGDFARTIQNLETAFLLDPQVSDTWARYLLYYCYLATADYGSALKTAEAIVKSDPHLPIGYFQVGIAQLWQGEAAAAEQSFRRVLEFEAHPPRTHFYMGLAEAALKNTAARDKAFAEAEAEYLQILKNNPKDFSANYELAALYLYWNHEVQTASRLVATAKESILQTPDEELPPDRKLFVSYYVPLLEGILLARTANAKESMKLLTDALSNAPSGSKADIAEIYRYLAEDYLKLGDEATARSFLEKGVALDPKGPYAAEMKGLLVSRK